MMHKKKMPAGKHKMPGGHMMKDSEMKEGGKVSKKKKTGQLSDAFRKNKGKLHRALGYAENQTIPKGVLENAAKQKGAIGKMARPAVNMAKARRKTKRGK